VQRTIVFGDAASISLDAARSKVAELRAAVAERRDPLRERRDAIADAIQAKRESAAERIRRETMLTSILEGRKPSVAFDFAVLTDATLEQCAAVFARYGGKADARLKSKSDTAMHLRLALKEMLAENLKPAELTRSKVSSLVQLHAEHPATARHRLGTVQRLYRWLMKVEAVSASPAADEQPPPPPAPRTTVYSAGQVKILWDGAEDLPPARRDLLRLLLLLPLRREELATTRKRDIRQNGNRLELVIEAKRSKNRTEHVTPIGGEARAIIERLLADARPTDAFLIPLTQTGRPFNAWRRFAEGIRKATGVNFRPHDCRRLFASECGNHDHEDFQVIDAALNHRVSSSVTGAAKHYFHGKRLEARRRLFNLWNGTILCAAMSGRWPREDENLTDNIVPFAGAGK
jgi:integrase